MFHIHRFFITINSMILYFKHIIHIDDFPLNGQPPSRPYNSILGKYVIGTLCLRNIGNYIGALDMRFYRSIGNIIIGQPLCPVVGRRPPYAASNLACIVLSSARSCRFLRICPGCLSILVVVSCRMVSKW